MKYAALLLALPGCFLFRSGDNASCPKDRSVELGLQEDVKKLAGCTQVAGVIIRTGATIDVTPLKDLEEITGDLSIGPTVGVDEVSFNGLLRVGGTIRVANNGSLRGLFFPRVEEIGRFEVDNNAVLTSISTPRLATVHGALVVTDNGGLELISAPLLATVGKELVIAGHRKLNLVEMPRLSSVEAVRIEANPKLPAEVVEQLTSKSSVKPTITPPTAPSPSTKAPPDKAPTTPPSAPTSPPTKASPDKPTPPPSAPTSPPTKSSPDKPTTTPQTPSSSDKPPATSDKPAAASDKPAGTPPTTP